MKISTVAIIGAGPYGLSLAAHLAALGVDHRILGQPMLFWSQIAAAGGERYLKSFCFGTNISSPTPGFAFADYSRPRGLETFEPCAIRDFAAYGVWFQQRRVDHVETVDVTRVARQGDGFSITLATGERFSAARVVVATGLTDFENLPHVLCGLPPSLVSHTSRIDNFADFKGRDVVVIGAGQSALEAAALLREAGANPQLIVRGRKIAWHRRTPEQRNLWQRVRSPLSGLGSGPSAWALSNFPGTVHRAPESWRTRFVKRHLPAEGAWWLRQRVENRVPTRFGMSLVEARAAGGRVALRFNNVLDGSEQLLAADHVIVGTGYVVDIKRLKFLEPELTGAIDLHHGTPRLNRVFESSVPGVHFIGPTSAMSFGPLFRFVAGARYTARTVSARMAA